MPILLWIMLLQAALASKAKAKMKSKSKQFFQADLLDQSLPPAGRNDKSCYDSGRNAISQNIQGQECPCDGPSCPPCILSKTERKMHERASKDARADQNTQSMLIKESDLQEKLFGAAQKYAGEVAAYEEEAKELALRMQKVASAAEVSRTKMIKAESQAKQLAMKTINTMTVYPPHSATKTPELTVSNAGYTQTAIKSYEPQYSIKIGDTGSDGYIDPITQSIYTDAARDPTQCFDAQTNQGPQPKGTQPTPRFSQKQNNPQNNNPFAQYQNMPTVAQQQNFRQVMSPQYQSIPNQDTMSNQQQIMSTPQQQMMSQYQVMRTPQQMMNSQQMTSPPAQQIMSPSSQQMMLGSQQMMVPPQQMMQPQQQMPMSSPQQMPMSSPQQISMSSPQQMPMSSPQQMPMSPGFLS